MAIHEVATTTQQNRHNNNTLFTFTELLHIIFASLHSPQHYLTATDLPKITDNGSEMNPFLNSIVYKHLSAPRKVQRGDLQGSRCRCRQSRA
jgi:hypothetical protein